MNHQEAEKFIAENQSEFSKLSDNLQQLFTKALTEEDYMKNEKCWHEVLITSNIPTLVDPDADLDGKNLTDEQKALMRLAYHSEEMYFQTGQINRIERDWAVPFAVPRTDTILRWIGDEKQGMMEEMVEYEHQKQKQTVPLWRALQLADENDSQKEFLNTMPLQRQMDLLFESLEFKHSHDDEDMYDFNSSILMRDEIVKQVSDKYGDIAVSYLDRFVEEDRDDWVVWNMFLTCAMKAGKAIKEEWEEYIPEWKLIDYLDYIAEDRKEAVIKKVVPKFQWATRTVNNAIELLKKFPCQPLIDAIAENYKDSDLPDRIALSKAMKAVPLKSEWYQQLRELLDSLPKIEELFVLSKTDASKPENLTKQQKVQLEIAMNKRDGKSFTLEQRYKHENEDFRPQNTVHEILAFSNAKGKPVVDVYLIGCDGCIFEAGTDKIFGEIIQNSIKMRKRKLKEALEYALYVRSEYLGSVKK